MNVAEFAIGSALAGSHHHHGSGAVIGDMMMVDAVFGNGRSRRRRRRYSSDSSDSSGSYSSGSYSSDSSYSDNANYANTNTNTNTNNTSLKQMLEEAEQQKTWQILQQALEEEREKNFNLKQWLTEDTKCTRCGKTYRRDSCLVRHIKDNKYEICQNDTPRKQIIKSPTEAVLLYNSIVEDADKTNSKSNKMHATVPHTNYQCHQCFKKSRKSCIIL